MRASVLSMASLVLACASTPVEDPATDEPGPEPVVFIEAVPRPAEPPPAKTSAESPLDGSSEADRERAKQLFAEGVEAFEAGDTATAVGYFEQAYALVPLPALLFNIARCREQLGDVAAACDAYAQLRADAQTDDGTRQAASDRAAALGC